MGAFRLSVTYNLRNRPVTFTRSGATAQTSRYAFNGLEQMVQRSTNAPGGPAGTVHYVYGLDGELLAEADGATGATLREYIWLPVDDVSPAADNDNEEGAQTPPLPLGLVTGVNTPASALLMVHADHLGRPLRLTDASRATVWAAAYDPFGQPLSITGAVEQNLRFPGQYFLLESGLSYNWHRFYDASTGRYTQPGPLRFVDGPSVYGYAGASPMMRVDPEGLAIGDFPPPPPGYDPSTWKRGRFSNGREYLMDPYGRLYIPHPEDKGHWRHWDKRGPGDGDDEGRWPPNSKKPWPNQKRPIQPDQCASDPSGDTPPWDPKDPFVPIIPIPSPYSPIPAWPIPEVPLVPVFP